MNIKSFRKKKKLTQEALAKEANVSRVSIARYESGERNPSLRVAVKLAKALGCTIDDLVKG